MGGIKGIYKSRLKSFHSPASVKLLLVHATSAAPSFMSKLKKFENSGVHLRESLRMDKCSLYNNLKGKLSCERGVVKCVSIAGKKLGCVGGSAYAYLDFGFAGGKGFA